MSKFVRHVTLHVMLGRWRAGPVNFFVYALSTNINELSEVCQMPNFSDPVLIGYPGLASARRMTHPLATPHMGLTMV